MIQCHECGKKLGIIGNYGVGSPLCFDCANKDVTCSVCGITYKRISAHRCKNEAEVMNPLQGMPLTPGKKATIYKSGLPITINFISNQALYSISASIYGIFCTTYFPLRLITKTDLSALDERVYYLMIFSGILSLISVIKISFSPKKCWAILVNGTLQVDYIQYKLSDFDLIEDSDSTLKFIDNSKTICVSKNALRISDLNDLICIISEFPTYKRI